jgi:hypothetical protein
VRPCLASPSVPHFVWKRPLKREKPLYRAVFALFQWLLVPTLAIALVVDMQSFVTKRLSFDKPPWPGRYPSCARVRRRPRPPSSFATAHAFSAPMKGARARYVQIGASEGSDCGPASRICL